MTSLTMNFEKQIQFNKWIKTLIDENLDNNLAQVWKIENNFDKSKKYLIQGIRGSMRVLNEVKCKLF